MEHATAGEFASFHIGVRNGQESDMPAERFLLELRSGSGSEYVTGMVEGPMDGGLFQASYCCTSTGLYTATVKVGRFPLPGCPFQLLVSPDVTDPEHCTTLGEGMYECMEMEKSSLVVETRDKHGNRTKCSEDAFRAFLKGGGRTGKGRLQHFHTMEIKAKVRSNGDGTFTISYTPPIQGAYSLKLEYAVATIHDNPDDLAWVAVAGSPFQLRCHPNAKRLESERLAAEKAAFLSTKIHDRSREIQQGAAIALANATAMAAKQVSQRTNKPKGYTGGGEGGKRMGLRAMFGRADDVKQVEANRVREQHEREQYAMRIALKDKPRENAGMPGAVPPMSTTESVAVATTEFSAHIHPKSKLDKKITDVAAAQVRVPVRSSSQK
jgi:hypothetical protein